MNKVIYRTAETQYNQEENKISGYASRYDTNSVDMGFGDFHYYERISQGAFNKVLEQNDDVRCLLNHDSNYVIGRTKSGTLELQADDKGLYFTCEYDPEISWQRDLAKSMQRGDISQCSFAFTIGENDYTVEYDKENKTYTRTIGNFEKLYDVSVVTYPAYEDTSVSARGLEEVKAEIEKIEAETDDKEAQAREQEQSDKDLVLLAKSKLLL